MTKRILAADIGGTSSRFAVFEAQDNGDLSCHESHWIKTEETKSLGDLFGQLAQSGFPLAPSDADVVALAVAGPIERGHFCAPPFISWSIDLSKAKEEFEIARYVLINDFVAQAYACPSLVGQEAEQILPRGSKVSNEQRCKETVAVVGAGTNLGTSILVPDKQGKFLAIPSEGGHVSFPIQSKPEIEFAKFVCAKLEEPYVTCNNAVSGKGIAFIHEFLTGKQLAPAQITKVWSDLSLSSTESETLLWASRFYGRVCRNFALNSLALGGVFIAGGVAANAPILVKHDVFMEEFRSSPSHPEILKKLPVFLITNEESGLWGAAFCGLQSF